MKTILLSPVAALAALVFTGCQTREGAYAPVNADKHDLENRARVVLMDRGAQRSITTAGLQETTLPDGRLEVAVNLRNRENRRLQVQVDCVFKDARGFEVDAVPFQTLILTENAQETVRFTSLNAQAKKFTIRVREAR
jgi:uncharacterized protein YcfL